MVSSAVRESRRTELLNILNQAKVKVSSGPSKYKRPTSTAEKRKAKVKVSTTKKKSVKKQCSTLLKKKISVNMKEMKKGRWKSRAQAVAVSYSQTLKAKPACSRHMKRRKSRTTKH